MNYEERNEQSRTYRGFHTSMDLGMGVVYILIGLIVLYVKYFGSIELPNGYAYALGGLMVLYGVFRIYRGFAAMKRQKQDRMNSTRDRML